MNEDEIRCLPVHVFAMSYLMTDSRHSFASVPAMWPMILWFALICVGVSLLLRNAKANR